MGAEAIVAAQVVGGVMKAQGAAAAAKQQKIELNYQADIDQINARTAELSAQSTLISGQRQEQASRMKTAQVKSTQRANLAANGIDLGSVTAQNILTSTDVVGEVDANTIAANAVASAWGYRTQATNAENDALMKRPGASTISPTKAAFTSLLGSATNVAASQYQSSKVR